MTTLLQDFRFAGRAVRRSPVPAAAAVICLALGVGLNTTIFSIVQAVLLRPLPFADASRIVAVHWSRLHFAHDDDQLSYLSYRDLNRQSQVFEQLAAYADRSVVLGGTEPERVEGELASANLFRLLGIPPARGRGFLAEDDRPGAAPVIVLSDALWHRRFHADPGILGTVVSVNGAPTQIVGVMPPGFAFPKRAEAWVPLTPIVAAEPRDQRDLAVLGSLRSGVSIDQARADVGAVAHALAALYPRTDAGWGASLRPVREELVNEDLRLSVLALMGAVISVLLIACANVANLQLTRASGRQREIAVRAALGAPRWRLMLQLVAESVLLALVGGALGLLIAVAGVRFIAVSIPADHAPSYWMRFDLDLPVLLFTFGAALASGVLAGLAPALTGSRADLVSALKAGGRTGAAGASRRLRDALVVVEISFAVVLLIGAALFARSFLALRAAGSGFDPAPLLSLRLYLPGAAYDDTEARRRRIADVVQRISALPGVESVGASYLTPLAEGGDGAAVRIEDQPVPPGQEPGVFYAGVTAGFLHVLGVPLRSGRELTHREVETSERAAVINETFARRFWPQGTPLGRRFQLQRLAGGEWFTVVGVVADFANEEPHAVLRPSAYIALPFELWRNVGILVRTGAAPGRFGTAVRKAVRASDPALAVFRVQAMARVSETSLWSDRLLGRLFGTFGAVALLLAAVGVYGVLSYAVSQRRREIGLRIALGARDSDVLRLVIGGGMKLALLGVGCGVVGALVASRIVARVLYNVRPTDPASFALVLPILLLVALAASYIPARAALDAEPLEALRHE